MSEDIGELVDEYGELDSKKKLIEGRLKELKKEIGGHLSIGEAIVGSSYVMSMAERITTVLNSKKVLKLVGEKKFLDVIKVLNSKVGEYLSKADMDKCTKERSVSEVITCKARK